VADAAQTSQYFDDDLEFCSLVTESTRFPIDAFAFVQEGLRHTVDTLERCDSQFNEHERHVSGRELCLGLRDYAIDQYGMLARTVLECWGIKGTEDFGEIVFAMVDAGLMRTSDEDTIEDFIGVFHFDEAFDGDSVGVG